MAQHGAGQLDQAIANYDQILAALPQQPDALHLKGVAMAQMGDLSSGIELLQQAAAAKNDSSTYTTTSAICFGRPDGWKKPILCCVAPLISCRHMRRRITTLVVSSNKPVVNKKHRAAANLEPNNSAIHGNIGIVLEQLGRLEDLPYRCDMRSNSTLNRRKPIIIWGM